MKIPSQNPGILGAKLGEVLTDRQTDGQTEDRIPPADPASTQEILSPWDDAAAPPPLQFIFVPWHLEMALQGAVEMRNPRNSVDL